jgi:beta-lactamase class A
MAEDWDRQGSTRAAVTTMVRTAGVVVVLAAALGILYLSFRGTSGHGAPGHAAVGSSSGWGSTGGGPSESAVPAATADGPVAPHTTARPQAAAHASPLGPPVRSYLSGRSGTVRVAIYDLATGQEWSLGGGAAQDEASVVKVNVLETLLAQRPAGLTAYDQALAQRMIEESDNDAATTLWNLVGGSSGIGAYDAQAGLTQTSPSTCVQCPRFPWPGWGLTTTTPEDQVTLLRRLVQPSGPLGAAARQYALSLMESVTPDQRWGVSGGVPAGVTVALKNGWLPLDAANSDWQINSVGWVSGAGRDYVLAMLSTGNPSEQYGIDTLNALGSMVWQSLG